MHEMLTERGCRSHGASRKDGQEYHRAFFGLQLSSVSRQGNGFCVSPSKPENRICGYINLSGRRPSMAGTLPLQDEVRRHHFHRYRVVLHSICPRRCGMGPMWCMWSTLSLNLKDLPNEYSDLPGN